MSGFIKMTKETWRFYLSILLIVIFFVVCDSVYICNDREMAWNGMPLEQYIKEEVEKARESDTVVVPMAGKELYTAIQDKGTGLALLGFWVTMFGIMTVLFVKQFVFMDKTALEFQNTWPVKGWVRVLHEYLSVLGIILFGGFLQLIILLMVQTNYNQTVIKISEQMSLSVSSGDFVSDANKRLVVYVLFYMLFIIGTYTWLYLGMTLAKNPLAGAGIALFVYIIIYSIFYSLISDAVVFYLKILYHGDAEQIQYIQYMVQDNIIRWITDLINSNDFFSAISETGSIDGHSMVQTALVMFVFGLFLFALIMIAANKREITRGKLLYFPALDYPLSFLFGLALLDYMEGDISMRMAVGFFTAVVLCMLIHPFFEKKSQSWEVK